jgi:TP901 family phage tail tape measure protein
MVTRQAIEAGRASVTLSVDPARLIAGLNKAAARLKRFGATVRQIGRQIGTIGFALTAPFIAGARVFAEFDDSMRTLRAVSKGTEEEFQTLTKTVKTLGRNTSFTAREIAEAGVTLGRATFSRAEINKALGAFLNLARAARSDLPQATKIAAEAMRGFVIPTNEAVRVADTLGSITFEAAGELEDFGEALKFVTPFANNAQQSLEETVAALGALKDGALVGTTAGTSLARMYKNLAQEGKELTLGQFNIQIEDTNQNMRKIVDIAEDMNDAIGNLGTRVQLSIYEDTFGRGAAAAQILANNVERFRQKLKDIQREGVSEDVARQMDAGVGGAIRLAISGIEGIGIAIGEAIEGPLIEFGKRFKLATRQVSEFVSVNKELVRGLFFTAISITAAGIGLFAIGTILSTIGVGIIAFSVIVKAVFLAVISKIGLATSSIFIFAKVLNGVPKSINSLFEPLRNLKRNLGGIFRDFNAAFDTFKKSLAEEDLSLALTRGFVSMAQSWNLAMGSMEQEWISTAAAIKNNPLVSKGELKTLEAELVASFGETFGDTINKNEREFRDFIAGTLNKIAPVVEAFEEVALETPGARSLSQRFPSPTTGGTVKLDNKLSDVLRGVARSFEQGDLTFEDSEILRREADAKRSEAEFAQNKEQRKTAKLLEQSQDRVAKANNKLQKSLRDAQLAFKERVEANLPVFGPENLEKRFRDQKVTGGGLEEPEEDERARKIATGLGVVGTFSARVAETLGARSPIVAIEKDQLDVQKRQEQHLARLLAILQRDPRGLPLRFR